MNKPYETLLSEISRLIVDTLDLEDVDPLGIQPDEPLFEDGLGLDSIDALEIGAALSRHYQIKLKSQSEENQKHFRTLGSLARFVEEATAGSSS